MTMFKRILVPIDGSKSAEQAVCKAVSIAELCGSEIDLVYAANVNGYVGGYPLSDSADYPNAILADVVQTGNRILEQAADLVPDTYKVTLHCVMGTPAEEILRLSEEFGSDLIIMGCRGLGAIKSVLLGSVSQYTVEHAKCPVMVVKDKK